MDVWMWELDHKESRVKNWCFWTVALEKTLESPLDCKGIQPVHPKGNQSWVLIGKTDVEAENPILWPPDEKNWLIGKDPDAGKDWGQEEKGTTEDEMVGWHHRLNGRGFEWTAEVGDGQGGLACCDSWGCKESDMTEQLNWVSVWSSLVIKSIKFCQQYRRPGFDLCVRKIPWRREWQFHSIIFFLENSKDRPSCQATVLGVVELDMTERLTHKLTTWK